MRFLFLCALFLHFSVSSHSQNSSAGKLLFSKNDDSIDIAKVFLELEKELNPAIHVETYLNQIDCIAQIVRCEFDSCRDIQDSLDIISQFIFQKQELSFQDDCEFISDIFDKQCGNCASFSACYLAVANRLGIKNIYSVLAPSHVFLRYDRNGRKINIETTQQGNNYSNDWYRYYFHVSEKFMHSDTYFRNLSIREFIAVLINNRGSEFLRKGNRKKAYEDFNTAISIFPTLAEAYFGLADYYNDLGDTKKALQGYGKVIQYNSEFANVYCNRGLLYDKIGLLDSAIKDYNAAIRINPNFKEIFYNRGVVYTKKGNYAQALNDFTTAITMKSDYADAYYNRGCARNLSKDYAGAVRDYTTTINLGHATADTYIYRGDCRNAIGDKKGACEDWNIGFKMGYKSKNKKRILKYCGK